MSPDWWHTSRTISIIVDNDSWVLPYAKQLVQNINTSGDTAVLYRSIENLPHGDIAFYLGCVKITPPETLAKHKKNLVVHTSDLPKGRGFSPMTWLILDGCDTIPVSLIEAVDEVDAGPIVIQEYIHLHGHELNANTRHILGDMHVSVCMSYVQSPNLPIGKKQSGEPTFYARRHPHDSELSPNRTIAEQFNLLRVVDNDRYPAFFYLNGKKYILKIEIDESE